jgi:hypothetical protein
VSWGRGISYRLATETPVVGSTITPIRVHHELVLQVFFSVDGEDLQGNPLEGDDSSGVMRMLVLTMPTVLPSVSLCSSRRRTGPGD